MHVVALKVKIYCWTIFKLEIYHLLGKSVGVGVGWEVGDLSQEPVGPGKGRGGGNFSQEPVGPGKGRGGMEITRWDLSDVSKPSAAAWLWGLSAHICPTAGIFCPAVRGRWCAWGGALVPSQFAIFHQFHLASHDLGLLVELGKEDIEWGTGCACCGV